MQRASKNRESRGQKERIRPLAQVAFEMINTDASSMQWIGESELHNDLVRVSRLPVMQSCFRSVCLPSFDRFMAITTEER